MKGMFKTALFATLISVASVSLAQEVPGSHFVSSPLEQEQRPSILISFNPQTSCEIEVQNVAIEHEKPEASFSTDNRKALIEVPLTSGTLIVEYRYAPEHRCWLLTTSIMQGQERITFARAKGSITSTLVPDFMAVPKVVFDKQSQTLTISLAIKHAVDWLVLAIAADWLALPGQKTKTVIPVAIK